MPDAKPDADADRHLAFLFEGLFLHTADGVILGRPDGAILRANPAACRMIGRSEEELIRLGRAGLVLDDPALAALIKARGEAGAATGRLRYRRGDGTDFPVEATTAVIPVPGAAPHVCILFRDVTAREQVERAQAESEALLREVLDGIPDPVFLKDRESRWRFMNRAGLEQLGLRLEQVVGRTDEEIFGDPAVGAALAANDRRIMAAGRTEVVEESVPVPGGQREYRSFKTPYRDGSGRPCGIVGYAQAAEPHRQAEELIALQSAIANLPIGVVVVDLPGDGPPRVLAFNAAYVRMVRSPPDRGASLDRLTHQLFPPDRSAPLPAEDWPGPRAARTGQIVLDEELHLRLPDGSWRVLSASAAPVAGGAGPGRRAIAVLLDVTQTHAARARVEAHAAHLQAAVDVAGLGLWHVDGASGAVGSSEILRRIAGLGPGDGAGELATWFDRIHPDDAGRVRRWTDAGGQPPPGDAPEGARGLRFRFVWPDGSVRWVETRAVQAAEGRGPSPDLLGATRDISVEVEEQEQLRALTARLQSVREEENARIARDLHDDLGQALTALQMELRAIDEQVARLGPPEAAGPIIDRVVSATELAAGTLRTVQRISQEIHPEVLGRLGLEAALRQELRRFSERTGLAVACSLDPVALPGAAARALFRIAQEALTNVARHAAARRVELRLAVAGGAATLEVLDDGRGLPPGGAGTAHLGLLGMRERARSVGGGVVVGPREGGGTVVRATVPVAAAP